MNNTSAATTFPTPTRLTSTQNVMLGGLCAMYLMTYVDRVNLSTVAPVLQHDLGLTTAELGLIFSAFAVPYGFLQPIGGWLGDRYGPRWVLFGVGVLWAGATLFTGLAMLQYTGSWQVPFATSVVLLFIGVLLSLRIDPTHPLEIAGANPAAASAAPRS